MAAQVNGVVDDAFWESFLRSVELVQLNQGAAFYCLAKHHVLERVYLERLTAKDMPDLPARLAVLREAEPHQATLRQQLADVRRLNNGSGSKVEREIIDLLEAHRAEVLNLGAAVRLVLAGDLAAVSAAFDVMRLCSTLRGQIEKAVSKLRQWPGAKMRW